MRFVVFPIIFPSILWSPYNKRNQSSSSLVISRTWAKIWNSLWVYSYSLYSSLNFFILTKAKTIVANNESNIYIDKTHKSFGLWTGERIVLCKAKKAFIKWLIRQCELFDSPFDQNQQYLIVKNEGVDFSFDELELDSELNEQNQRIYDELLSKHILKMQNAYPPQPSILFIIPIESIVIPHPAWYTPIILNITLNDFRPLYSITLSQTEVNTEIEDYIDWLDDHIQLEVNILRSVVYINEVHTIFFHQCQAFKEKFQVE